MNSRWFLTFVLGISGCAAVVGPNDGSVDAHASTDVNVPNDAGACRSATVVELRAPRVVRQGTSATVAAVLSSGGCSCSPGLRSSPAGLEFTTCNCCDLCPCIDPNYIVNAGPLPLSLGSNEVPIVNGGMRAVVEVIPADRVCLDRNLSIDTLRVETDAGLRRFGPPVIWAEIRGTALRCDGMPLPWVNVSQRESNLFVRQHDCNTTDCDGPTRPVPYTTWIPLGTLSTGSYTLFYNSGATVQFTVD